MTDRGAIRAARSHIQAWADCAPNAFCERDARALLSALDEAEANLKAIDEAVSAVAPPDPENPKPLLDRVLEAEVGRLKAAEHCWPDTAQVKALKAELATAEMAHNAAREEIGQARRTAEYWKAEHWAANEEIGRLEASVIAHQLNESASADSLSEKLKEIARLKTEMKAGESFHAVAVAERNAAWAEVERLKAQLVEAEASKKRAWDEAVQARVDGAENIEAATTAVEADLAAALNDFRNRVGTEEDFRAAYRELGAIAEPQGTGASLATLARLAVRRFAAREEAAIRAGYRAAERDHGGPVDINDEANALARWREREGR